jgi:hypothetical protein
MQFTNTYCDEPLWETDVTRNNIFKMDGEKWNEGRGRGSSLWMMKGIKNI